MKTKTILSLIVAIAFLPESNGETLNATIYHDPVNVESLLLVAYEEEGIVTVIFESAGPFWEYDFWSERVYKAREQRLSMEVPFPLLVTNVIDATYPPDLQGFYDSVSFGSPVILYLSSPMAERLESGTGIQLIPDAPIVVEEGVISVEWRTVATPEFLSDWSNHQKLHTIYQKNYPLVYGAFPDEWMYVSPIYSFNTKTVSDYSSETYDYQETSLGFWFYSYLSEDWLYSSFDLTPYAWSDNEQTWVTLWGSTNSYPYGEE